MTTDTFVTRSVLVDQLVIRDGLVCMHPDCGRPIDLDAPEGPLQVTIDHWMPQWWCKEQGWSDAKIWALDNLFLFHKKCNAKKGGIVPNPDGTLPEKAPNTFKYRRDKRAERPEVCKSCNAGRNLGPNEVCASCNSGPLPERYPRWAKVPSSECDHELFWCYACASGLVDRPSALSMILTGGEGGSHE